MSAASETVLVATVAYRSDALLPGLVGSLADATSRHVHLVIVNNGPEAVTPLSSSSPRLRITVVETGANLGYGRAINYGVREAANGEMWVLGVNPDLVFEAGAIDVLIDRSTRTGAAIAGPLVKTPAGEIYPSARRLPSLRHRIGHAVLGKVMPSNPFTRAYTADRELPPREREAGWLSGACLLIRADAFTLLAGFDETYFMYFEDVDLSARAHAAGLLVLYVPSAIVTHVGGDSTKNAARAMINAHHESAYQYLSRRYRGWHLAPVRLALRVGLGIRKRVVRS